TSCAVALLGTLTGAFAQPKLPPPEATDPVARGIMIGLPPPPDKRVTLDNVLAYPNARWAFHHMRELCPPSAVWHGEQGARAGSSAAAPLERVSFEGADARATRVEAWLQGSYTDAILVLHRGR